MSAKRTGAGLIPYLYRDGKVFVYMQMRDEHASKFPNTYGFFGGGAEEGETPLETLRREILEELEFEIPEVTFFKFYEKDWADFHMFLLAVDESFPDHVVIHEGRYGAFVPFDSTDESIPEHNREILAEVAAHLQEI